LKKQREFVILKERRSLCLTFNIARKMKIEEIKKNIMSDTQHIPIIIANTSPFRLIKRNEEDIWAPTIDEINDRKYDYVKLHRLSGFINAGISLKFPMAVAFDGSFILPCLPELKEKNSVLEVFNRAFCKLMLGGVFYHAVSPADISYGRLTLDGYFKSCYCEGHGHNYTFHHVIGTTIVGPLDSIKLLAPKSDTVEDIKLAFNKGAKILEGIPTVSPTVLLNGISYRTMNQWSDALINIWTCIEQVLEHIWREKVVTFGNQKIPGRKDLLKDNRTWAISTKIELLYQRSVLDFAVYSLLNKARKARNNFIHRGSTPQKDSVDAAIKGLFHMASLLISEFANSNLLTDLIEEIKRYDPYDNVREEGKVTHWLPIPPIPGDTEWGDKQYETFEDICLVPISYEDG